MTEVNGHPACHKPDVLQTEGMKPRKWHRFIFFLGGWSRGNDFADAIDCWIRDTKLLNHANHLEEAS